MGRRIDLSGAEIRADPGDGSPPIFLPRQPAASPLLALDIGGTLIKLVYTASCGGQAELRFAKFERRRLDDCFDFVRAQGLLGCNGSSKENVTLKATGGGSYKFGDYFRQKLGNVPGAAFTHMEGKRNSIDISPDNMFPYLLVNIGSGVSILKVTGNRKFERVTGTHIGGGTMFGLAKLLTGCKRGQFVLDLVVKDISLRELVCQKQGLSTSTLASSFGKVITSMKKLADYKPEDLASALLSAFTYNIAQISFLVASLLGLRRVFLVDHMSWTQSTMDNISYSQMQASFLQHEGYLGALGALMSYGDPRNENLNPEESQEIGLPASTTGASFGKVSLANFQSTKQRISQQLYSTLSHTTLDR
ncbi:hypothetical protein ZWY2020_049937 [Hordeum vulgare]|nr:hypothetical protein ZWY2020_049937 [Hordeum vulgare]